MRSVSVLVCLLVLGGLPGPAVSERPALHLDRPRLSGAGARLTGRAPGTMQSVELQRRTRGQWRAVRELAVRDGGFRTRVAPGRSLSRSASSPVASTARYAGSRPGCPPTSAGRDRARTAETRWSCTFHDDFDGAAVDRGRWRTVTRSPRRTRRDRGLLPRRPVGGLGRGRRPAPSVRPLPAPMICPTGSPVIFSSNAAGMVSTSGLFSQQYGRFEARYRSAAVTGPGLQEAFWLWPDHRYGSDRPWPLSGEIDIAETYSVRPDLAIPFLHYTANDNGGPVPGTNTAWDCTAWRGSWHTYTLEWSPSRIEIWVDGRSAWSTRATTPPSTSGTSSTSRPPWASPTTPTRAVRRCRPRWTWTTCASGSRPLAQWGP